MLYIVGTIQEGKKRLVVIEPVDNNFKPTGRRIEDEELRVESGRFHCNELGQLILEVRDKASKREDYEALQRRAKELGIPANQKQEDLEAAIHAAEEQGH